MGQIVHKYTAGGRQREARTVIQRVGRSKPGGVSHTAGTANYF